MSCSLQPYLKVKETPKNENFDADAMILVKKAALELHVKTVFIQTTKEAGNV